MGQAFRSPVIRAQAFSDSLPLVCKQLFSMLSLPPWVEQVGEAG